MTGSLANTFKLSKALHGAVKLFHITSTHLSAMINICRQIVTEFMLRSACFHLYLLYFFIYISRMCNSYLDSQG